MLVRLLNYSPRPIETIFTAARTCYSSSMPSKIWSGKYSEMDMTRLLDKTIAAGHHSILEHISFTFAIEGISRACSHQLVRHRIASFSQQSQRYVDMSKAAFVVPPSVEFDNYEALQILEDAYANAQRAYKRLLKLGIPEEDARFVMPNGTATNLVMTMNFRELMQVSQIRLCTRAQWEIRELFSQVKSEIKSVPELSGLGDYLQPKCIVLGYCPEYESCGMMPTKKETLGDN